MVQRWSKFVQHWLKHGPKMVINDPKIFRIWSKKGATSPSVMVLSAVYQQLMINSSSVHGQFIISSSSVCHQFIIRSSSVYHQVIVSSSSVHYQFIVKLGPKNITQIGLRAFGQRLIHRSINLTISKFNWPRQLCSQLCSLCSNYSMWSIINNYVPKVNGDIPPSLMVLLLASRSDALIIAPHRDPIPNPIHPSTYSSEACMPDMLW